MKLKVLFQYLMAFLPFIILTGLVSCKKGEETFDAESSGIMPSFLNRISKIPMEEIDENHASTSGKMRVLGVQYSHPFGIENMRKAFHNLYPKLTKKLPVSHRYVRFLPKSSEDLIKLDKSDLVLLDTPFDYEIKEQGSYYHDPAISGEYTYLYTVAQTDQPLPDVSYEVLEELFLPVTDANIMAEACRILEIPYKKAGLNSLQISPEDLPVITDDMTDDEVARIGGTTAVPWHPPVAPIDGGGGPVVPTCNRSFNGSPDGVPSGRVTLDDSQLGTEGVRRIKMICIGMFYIESDETDDCGYYEMNRNIAFDVEFWFFGTQHIHIVPDVWYTTQFENDRARFRTTHIGTSILGQYEMTTTHSIGVWAAPHNGRNFNYNPGGNVNDEATRFWVTAQANNALHDFYDFSADTQIGIAPPPKRLEVLLNDFQGGSGVAPMIARNYATGGNLPAVNAGIVIGLCGLTVASAPLAVTGPWGASVTALSAGATIIAARVALSPPDVIIGYNFRQGLSGTGNCLDRWRQSDLFRSLCYHEFAHAGHYSKVGNTYWEWNMQYMVTHGNNPDNEHPYGSGTADGHERCEIIEGWATLIEYQFTHKKYPTLFGRCFNSNPYEQRLENLYKGWYIIPQGLFYDLEDNVADLGGNDAMDGLTTAQIYSKLDAHTHGYKYLRDRLVDLRPTRAADIDRTMKQGYNLNY
jgi:hypothetical protein